MLIILQKLFLGTSVSRIVGTMNRNYYYNTTQVWKLFGQKSVHIKLAVFLT